MLETLIPRSRLEMLALLLMNPDKRYYLREMAVKTGLPVQSVQREVVILEKAGLLKKDSSADRNYYQADAHSPVFQEFRMILIKTRGVAGPVRERISKLKNIEKAFIYGSVAAGTDEAKSDIDLFILGSPDQEQLHKAIQKAEEKLGREINTTVMDQKELQKRKKAGESFLKNVLSGPKVPVIGDVDGI